MRRLRALIVAIILCAHAPATPSRATEFQVRSADGTEIRGDFHAPSPTPQVAVIFVPGTGLYDRDVLLGMSKTPRDLIFKDLASRMEARGLATVRADVRGVRYGAAPDQYDRKLLAGRTTGNMLDDLAAIYGWSRSPEGLGARCIVFFAHSEGTNHLGRLAERGAPAPAMIIGMGAAMQSPSELARWQYTERDAYSLKLMDADQDGVITNDEVRENWGRTPSSVYGLIEPFLHSEGAWRAADLAELRAVQMAFFHKLKADELAHADTAPYPDDKNLYAAYQWRKSWFLDERPVAANLARWETSVRLHYGDKDSQVDPAEQTGSASAHLKAGTWTVQIYPGRGHTLGEDVLFGPVDEAIANKIADEAATALTSCR